MKIGISFASALLCAAMSAPAFGQGVVTQWRFNSNPPDANTATGTITPNIGSGSATTIGGTSQSFASGVASNGSTDTTAADNSGWNIAGYPAPGTNSGTAGVQYSINTTGQSNLVFRFDNLFSSTANRFVRVEYTTNGGTNWTSAAVFTANLGQSIWYNNRTVDLSGVTGVNNNSQFAIRVVSIFDPNGSDYVAVNPASGYGTSGTSRYDSVTLTNAHVWTGGNGTGLDVGGVGGNFGGTAAPGSTATVLLGTAGGPNTTVTTASGGTTLDQIIFRSDAPAYTIGGSGTLTLNAGIVNSAASAHAFSAPVFFGNQNTIYNSGRLTFSGNVRFTNGLVLQGTGTTTVNGSVLATSSGTLTVADGAVLAGVGTIGRPVTVGPGGAIRAGDPNGTIAERTSPLTVNGNVTINPNGILRVEASRTGMDSAASGVLTVSGGGIFNFNLMTGEKFTIDLVNGANSLQVGETYTIQLAAVSGGSSNLRLNSISIGPNATVNPAFYTLTSSSFEFSNVSLTTGASGADLNLNFTITPVPEPAMLLGIAAGALGLFARVRHRVRITS